MNKNYTFAGRFRVLLLALLGLLVHSGLLLAQSGPVGNEWIRPGQTYYKIKILKDGLYKLDYQYLTQAGIGGVAPSQLQLWRRGREVAIYGGGNQTVSDPTTFLAFYAVHNDGRLDTELYRRAQDQAHFYYSFYTDTASYFLTWTPGQPGRRMAQPVAAGGAVHPHRLVNSLDLRTYVYYDYPATSDNYLPWVEAAEGAFGIGNLGNGSADSDSTFRRVAPTGPVPKLEILLYGRSAGAHACEVLVTPPGGTPRSLGVMRWSGRTRYRQTFNLLRSDVSSAGRITFSRRRDASSPSDDAFYACYDRFVVSQLPRWFRNRHGVAFQNDSTLAGPATYEIEADSIPATVVGLDVQDLYNVQRVVSTASGTRRRFVFPGATAATHNLLWVDEAFPVRPPLPARRVSFRLFTAANAATPNFIIITHPQLMAGPVNAAKEYARYRASVAGGRYDTLLVTTFQLYDQFTYGDRSWLALRHFARLMAAASPGGTSSTRNLLLLGKGITPSECLLGGCSNSFTLTSSTPRGAGERGLDLVPTSSRAVSDNLLTADYANNDYVAKLNTGRLTVTTPAQVMTYLAKLGEYETAGDQPWRKNVLHLTGGTEPREFVDFRAYMNNYKRHVESPLFGGRVVATIERTTVTGTGNSLLVTADITSYLNPGLGLISYFGHGSNNAFSLEIGTLDTNPTYNNPGKYPVMMYNGCAAGHLYTRGDTFFENWLFTPNKGAIGCMGETGFSYADYLNVAQDTLTRLLFNDPRWYGKPITAVYNETVRRLQRSNTILSDPNNSIAAEQLLCTAWHGDPTITLYAPPKPDFQVSNASVSISPVAPATTVTANSSTFSLLIGVANPLKVTTDPVEIRVTRTVGSVLVGTYTQTFPQGPQGSATYDFRLTNPPGVNVFGVNTFRVEIDYRNQVDEKDETNNTAQTTYTFLRGGLTVLNPVEFAIVGNNQPRLVAQTNDPAGAQRVYEFEADTSAAFTSSLKRASGPVTTTLTPSWRPVLPAVAGRDSVVWYWRVRFQTAGPDEDPNWTVSSFRIIQGRTAGGWSQSHYAQFRRDQRQGVEVAPSGRWDFSTQNQPLQLRTVGGGLPGANPTFSGNGVGIITNQLLPPTVDGCAIYTANLLVAVYDQRTLRPITGLPAPAVCGQAPRQYYIFATPANDADTTNTVNNSPARQNQLAAFLAAVPDGAYVAVVSVNRLRWPSLGTVRTAFSTLLGSQLVNQLQNGDPFTLVAQKRASGGRLIREVGPGTGTGAAPRYTQTVTLADTLRTPSSRGTVTSVRIGPSQGWENLYHWIQRAPNGTSSYTLKVIGIDTLNNSTVLFNNVPAGSPQRGGFSLNSVSAARYPYLQLELTLQDSLSRNAPQLKEWFITYRGVPEGVVRRDLANPSTVYDPATLAVQAANGASLTIPVWFENVTPFDFGTPLRAKVELRDAAGGTVRKTVFVNAPRLLKGDSTIIIRAIVPVVGLFGSFTTKVTVNPTPKPLPEINLFNNELNLAAFSVIDTNVPPILDVAIDGRHILNGELVSSRPVIAIQLNDEDKFRHITDRSVFTLSLLRPGQTGAPTQVDLNGANVDFSVDIANGSIAKLTYEPGKAGPLADGVYTLRVQGRDPSNASAGSQDFQVQFEVVRASQITNVYPYPNPVINKARFVFTLTGQQLPTNMKIQIMTLTGRVVREIFMSELGPLHIGNNISDFAWDGTDAYGDRLANGTYLYRVSLDDPGSQFTHRATAGDQAFKNDWGKLVLMR